MSEDIKKLSKKEVIKRVSSVDNIGDKGEELLKEYEAFYF